MPGGFKNFDLRAYHITRRKESNLGIRNDMLYHRRNFVIDSDLSHLTGVISYSSEYLHHLRAQRRQYFLSSELRICTVLQACRAIISYRCEFGICTILQGRHAMEVSSVSLPSSREDTPLYLTTVCSATVPSSMANTPLFPTPVSPVSLPSSRVDKPIFLTAVSRIFLSSCRVEIPQQPELQQHIRTQKLRTVMFQEGRKINTAIWVSFFVMLERETYNESRLKFPIQRQLQTKDSQTNENGLLGVITQSAQYQYAPTS